MELTKSILVGNLGKDPEIRYTADGRPIANFSIATSESWMDKNSGEKREKPNGTGSWCLANWLKFAGSILAKGSKFTSRENFKPANGKDQDGQDRYTTEVVVDFGGTMQMLGSRDGGGGGGSRPSSYGANSGGGSGGGGGYQDQGYPQPPYPNDQEDDIPF